MERLRARLTALVDHPVFQRAVLGLILLNAGVLACETIPSVAEATGPALRALDMTILALFTLEIGLRIFARGAAFFRDPWSVFDFAVVAISFSSLSGLTALRAFRVFRVLRLVTALPRVKAVVSALLGALPGVASVAGILVIILFVASVIATKLFATAAPDHFGDLFSSMFTLFQVMTLEGWPDVASQVLAVYPLAWIFFVVYILIATLTMLNLFVAIIVDAMESEALSHTATRESQDDILLELRAIRTELSALRSEAPGAAPSLRVAAGTEDEHPTRG